MEPAERDALVRAIVRPDKNLLVLYVLQSLLLGPAFLIPLIPLYFRYHTLRYGFGDDGISVSWGILFRREVHLTYRRVQDIHVTRNIVERWLGIGTVSVQTASGSGDAEAQIAGVREFDAIRDFLYARMRGLEDHTADHEHATSDTQDEAVQLLEEIRDTLRLLAAQAATQRPDAEEAAAGDSGGDGSILNSVTGDDGPTDARIAADETEIEAARADAAAPEPETDTERTDA
ncbi:MAG: PH domain-containing protein [bacterium]|nr:PH domain-containing protein [bacterium]